MCGRSFREELAELNNGMTAEEARLSQADASRELHATLFGAIRQAKSWDQHCEAVRTWNAHIAEHRASAAQIRAERVKQAHRAQRKDTTMCHVGNLNDEELARLRRMDVGHRMALETELEYGQIPSRRCSVVPVFEKHYALWCDLNGIVNAPRKPERISYTAPEAVMAFR